MTEPLDTPIEKQPPTEVPRSRFGRSGNRELESLKNSLEEARAIKTEDREKKIAIAEKRIKLFMVEHDAAGAFKLKRFTREVLATMDEQSVERSPDGRLAFKGKEKQSRLMFVNMGELDRFNTEGGAHSSGDQALTETVRAIEAILGRNSEELAKNGGEMTYSIYRYAGNEYAVRIDGVDEQTFNSILTEVRSAKPTVEGVKEPAPIVAEGFSMNEVLDILNDVDEQMPDTDRVGPENRNLLTRSFIDIMRRRAEFSLDVDKFHKRVERILEKIGTGDLRSAEEFFKKYLAKAFKGAGANGKDLVFEDFVQMSKLESNERFIEEHRIGELAFNDADTHLVEGLALKGASKELHKKTQTLDVQSRIASAIALQKNHRNSIRPPYMVDPGIKIAEIPTSSAGHSVMLEKRTAYEKAISEGLEKDDVEIAQLEMQFEDGRRDGSVAEGKFTGTGLLDRGSYYERLGEVFESKQEKPRTTVFVDMGFLKYFDQRGGRDVGNNALRLAASLMEQATVDSGVKAEVFRYGGDEFTIIIDGGESETKKYLETLLTLKSQAGAVNAGALGGEQGYIPTALSFNYGISDTTMAEQAYNDLLEGGSIPEGGDVPNLKAELMTLIADKAIERQKAADRFELLVFKIIDAKKSGKQTALAQAEDLLFYSQKAIRGKEGEEFLRSLVNDADAPEDPVAHISQVRERINDWLEKNPEKKEVIETERNHFISSVVELYGHIAAIKRKYLEVAGINQQLSGENEALLNKQDALLKSLASAEQALKDLKGARANIANS